MRVLRRAVRSGSICSEMASQLLGIGMSILVGCGSLVMVGVFLLVCGFVVLEVDISHEAHSYDRY